jgi:hypothetical protein
LKPPLSHPGVSLLSIYGYPPSDLVCGDPGTLIEPDAQVTRFGFVDAMTDSLRESAERSLLSRDQRLALQVHITLPGPGGQSWNRTELDKKSSGTKVLERNIRGIPGTYHQQSMHQRLNTELEYRCA